MVLRHHWVWISSFGSRIELFLNESPSASKYPHSLNTIYNVKLGISENYGDHTHSRFTFLGLVALLAHNTFPSAQLILRVFPLPLSFLDP